MKREIRITPQEEMVVLALYSGKRYSKEILTAIEEVGKGKYRILVPALYTILRNLEKKQVVESEKGENTGGSKLEERRRYYKLTKLGISVIEDVMGFRHKLAWSGPWREGNALGIEIEGMDMVMKVERVEGLAR